jgi:hypothetical protein
MMMEKKKEPRTQRKTQTKAEKIKKISLKDLENVTGGGGDSDPEGLGPHGIN